ncbi:ABC-type dipeptide/oligopeptide/nickel transport system permease subunit [Bradyrhizobium diazoefficiens]
MSVFVLRRVLTLLATLVGASLIIFLVLDALPGNAAQMLMGADASADAVRALTVKLGLDQPLAVRYLQWIKGLLVGDLGNSYVYGTPVASLIAERLVLTIPLAIMAMSITVTLALSAGIYTAANHNKLGDVGVMSLTQVGIALPNFWFAILLVLLFSVRLQWLSAGGFAGWEDGIWLGVKSLLLPAISLAVVQAAILARVTRSAVLEVLREDFVRTARAKGLGKREVLWRHVLRNAMIPVMTVMGLQFANLLAGTIVIENVFYLPGLGRLIFQSIAQPRPDRGAQLRDAAGNHGRYRQFRGRRALCLHRSPHQGSRPVSAPLTTPIDAAVATRPLPARTFWRRALRHRSFVLGGALSLLVLASALLSLVWTPWTPWSPYEIDIASKLRPPSAAHWLGTDSFGRDIVSLLLAGARSTIMVGIIAVSIGLTFGVCLGLIASARRGWTEEIIMRFSDFTFAFPAVLSAIMLAAVVGPGMVTSIVAIGIFQIPTLTRLTRGSANAIWAREFVLAARASGKGKFRITIEHVLPNILSILIVQATIQFALAILAEAALSYLGLGTQPPQPSWGRMLNDAQTLLFQSPMLAVYPGAAIAVAVLGLNLLGDGLRDLLDPRLARER